jgi:hypothetical protein
MGAAQSPLHQGMQKRECFHALLICYHARLVNVKNVSPDVSERQALSNLIGWECLNYWNGFYCSFARWPPVTQKTVASLRMAERCVYKYYTPNYVRCEAPTK